METLIKSLIEYHCALNRRLCASLAHITETQFTQDDPYSRGSIRNLMVHLISTDLRWLAGLKNLPDLAHLNYADYPDRQSLHFLLESVSQDLMEYVATLSTAALEEYPNEIPAGRWQILMHMVNHGTDHRATILQRLNEFGAPGFDQDYILWLWSKPQVG
jgi:uncharacterized damage-inducible protein DinB